MGFIDNIASWLASNLYALWLQVGWIFSKETFRVKPLFIIDIIIVALVFYWIYLFLKKTSASRYLPAFLIFVFLAGMGYILDLNAVMWLFSRLFIVLIVALPIIFQPEIRDALNLLTKKREKDEVHNK